MGDRFRPIRRPHRGGDPLSALAVVGGWVVTGLAAVSAAAFLRTLVSFRRTVAGVPLLEQVAPPAPPEWPTVSIVVPARDEAEGVEDAVRSLLASDYPALEVVVVDDRSTDGTGLLLDRLAERDERLRVVHVEAVPEGWLAKVHALRRGWDESSGELVLLCDADVHLAPGALRRAVAWAQTEGADLLTVIPSTWPADVWTDACWAASSVALVMTQRLWEVRDPDSPAHVGVGAFNLLRRAAFDATEGFGWLRLDVADDWAVGLLMKRAGAACAVLNGRGLVSLPWYRRFGDMLRGMEKNCYAILGRYRAWRCAAFAVGAVTLHVAPLVALALPADVAPWGVAVGAFATWLMLIAGARVNGWLGRPVGYAFLLPVGAALNAAIALRAAWRCGRRGGIEWRGTFYASEAMRPFMRVRF